MSKQLVLEKIKIVSQLRISQAMIEDFSGVEFETYFDQILGQMIFEMKGYFWGKTKTIANIKWPANWKEAFKERWFPKWLLKRFPVKYEYRQYDAMAAFPKLKILYPSNECIIYLEES